jgi:hypothetical protein
MGSDVGGNRCACGWSWRMRTVWVGLASQTEYWPACAQFRSPLCKIKAGDAGGV